MKSEWERMRLHNTLGLAFLFLMCFTGLSAQKTDLLDINLKRHYYNRNGMIILTSWAGANIVGGTAAYFATQNKEWKYFQEMNVFWNTVNLGLGVANLALAPKNKPDASWTIQQSQKAQRSNELVFGINTGLDALYVGGGIAMRLLAKPNGPAYERLRGYGTSLILQGSFLVVFDGIEFILNRRNGRGLYKKGNNFSFSTNGLGLGFYWKFS
jgi:hypothetical protein